MAKYGKVQANQYNNSANVGQVAALTPENGKAIGWTGGSIANIDVPQKQTAQRGIVTQHFQSIVGMSTTAPLSAETPFYFNNSGSGAGITQNTNFNPGTIGVITASTGGTASGTGAILARSTTTGSSTLISVGTGDVWRFAARFRAPILSDSAQQYAIGLGFFDTIAGAILNAVYIGTSQNPAQAQCAGFCRNNSVQTVSLPFFTLTQNTWHDAEIIYTSSLCTFTVDSASTSIASNIPTAIEGRRVGYGIGISKLAGNTARTIDVDYVQVEWDIDIV